MEDPSRLSPTSPSSFLTPLTSPPLPQRSPPPSDSYSPRRHAHSPPPPSPPSFSSPPARRPFSPLFSQQSSCTAVLPTLDGYVDKRMAMGMRSISRNVDVAGDDVDKDDVILTDPILIGSSIFSLFIDAFLSRTLSFPQTCFSRFSRFGSGSGCGRLSTHKNTAHTII